MPHIDFFIDHIFDMKDVRMDVPFIPMQSNYKNSSLVVINKIKCKTMKIDLKNSPKMISFF